MFELATRGMTSKEAAKWFREHPNPRQKDGQSDLGPVLPHDAIVVNIARSPKMRTDGHGRIEGIQDDREYYHQASVTGTSRIYRGHGGFESSGGAEEYLWRDVGMSKEKICLKK